ncbi:hypothetical protein LB507_006130 [Fusarium sp. FIESC RH6]|nr:hypothetical protein LB507_006130 [Fusarium sp. FIESC RH6]
MQNATDQNATYKAIFDNYAWVWFMIQCLADDPRWDQYITGYIAECPAHDDCDVDYETSWDSMSLREKSNHDIAILKDLWYEARIIKHHVPGYKATDEFIRGVQDHTIAGSDIPFSLVFAAQVTLDINHTVGKYAETSRNKVLEQIISINNSLNDYLEFEKDDRSAPHLSHEHEHQLQNIQHYLQLTWNDPLYCQKSALANHIPAEKEKLEYTEKHLKIYDIFGEEQFFFGGKPTKMDQYASHFMIQFGVSDTAVDDQLRKPDRIIIRETCKAGTRNIESRATVHHIVQDRYHKNKRNGKLLERCRQGWNAESIQEVLSRVHPEVMPKQPAMSMAPNKGTDKNKNKASTNIHLTLTRFLTYLGDALDLEKEELAFPYLSMDRTVFQEIPFIAGQILILAPKMEVLKSAAEALDMIAPSFDSASREMDKLIGRD